MSPHIALLRAVNVGGRKVLKDDLLGLAKDLGFDDAKTLLASGNLVLWGSGGSDADIEKRLEDGLEKRMGLRTEFFVRSPAELKAIIDANPYPDEVKSHPNHLLVHFMNGAAAGGGRGDAARGDHGPRDVQGRKAGALCRLPRRCRPFDAGSRLEEDQEIPVGTARNWNTVMKLAALAGL